MGKWKVEFVAVGELSNVGGERGWIGFNKNVTVRFLIDFVF